MRYNLCLEKLYSLNRFHKIKYDLENVRKLASIYNNPHKNLDCIHITGTNGKGSTAFKLAKILEKNNFKTGLFTSPHISTFRERFQINGQLIPKEYVEEFLTSAFQKREQMNLDFSFFELLTVMAFCYFSQMKVDFVCLEVGIGGRLDCTNIIEKNKLAIITSVGLDHCEILGETVELITREKCGLIKQNCPVLIGPNVNREIVSDFCKNNNSKLYQVEEKQNHSFLEINKKIVAKGVDVLNEYWGMDLKYDLETIGLNLPCRYEKVNLEQIKSKYKQKPDFISLDVGHNPMAINFFCQLLKKEKRREDMIIVFGTSGQKDSKEMLKTIASCAKKVYLIEAKSPRAKKIGILMEEAFSVESGQFLCIQKGDIAKTIQTIFDNEDLEGKGLAFCGSFFNMVEVRAELGYKDETDDYFLNEYSLETRK